MSESPFDGFASTTSEFVTLPIAGDARRDVDAFGSRLAVRAAFSRFSSASMAMRCSCSCRDRADA
jgi:hypothetical protein